MARSRSESLLSGPDKPLIIASKEQTEGMLSAKSLRDVFLWVDIAGVKFIDANSRKVQWFTPFNEITVWAVDRDFFKLRLLDKKNKLRERTFLCGSQKANRLKSSMEEMVKLYLQQPELVAELQRVAADFPVGSTVPKVELESADRFGTGAFLDPALANPNAKATASPGTGVGRKSRFGSVAVDGGNVMAEPIAVTSSDIWTSEPAMRGFPGRLIESSANARDVATDVIVIIKDNGVHTINKNAKQGSQQGRTFSFSHKQIVKTKMVGDELHIIVRGTEGAISILRYVFDADVGVAKIVEALAPYVKLRPVEKPPPAPRRAPCMFDDDGFEEENEAEEESYRVSQRVQQLAGIMQDCLERLGGLSTEEQLMNECMAFMEKLNTFVVDADE